MRVTARRTVGVLLVVAVVVGLAACEPERDGTRHDGFQGGPAGTGVSTTTIWPTAKVRWSFDPAHRGDVGEPIIVAGMVIAPVRMDDSPSETPDEVVAFDRLTGAVRWRTLVDDGINRIAAGGDRIIVSSAHTVASLELATGRPLWVDDAPPNTVDGAPVVVGRTAFIAGGPDRGISDMGTLTAYDVNRGFQWSVVTDGVDGSESSPVVSGDVVVVPGKCTGAQAYRRSDGRRLWVHRPTCTGGGSGGSAAIRDGRVYVGEASMHWTIDDGVILDARNGARLGTFRSMTAPAVGSSNLVTAPWDAVEAWSSDGRTRRWRHALPADLHPRRAPVVARQQVLVVVQDDRRELGYLLGLDLADGRQVLRVPLGAFSNASEGGNEQRWLAVGEQVAAVSVHGRLIVVG